jgi:rod shape determining protein RodA
MLIPILLLLILSVSVIFTSNLALALQQLIFSVIGLGFYYLLRNYDYRLLKPLIKFSYIGVIILLVITFIIGIETRGSVRWIAIGPFNLQPSELAKPILILVLAYFWSKNVPTWKNILKSFGILAPIWILVFRQPDLGTALTLAFIWGTVLLASNISAVKIVLIGLISSILMPLGWFTLEEYQKHRIISFLSPYQDPQGIGFHVIQSMIAVGSGGAIGRGLGRGTQSRLQFLPEFRTDFIFAFIAEELGFIGSFIVLFLYSALFFMAYRVLNSASDRFGELIVVGVLGMMFFQIVINIGMNSGLLPITGITLPLLSYGGSSIVATLISLGLIASVAKYGLKRQDLDTLGSKYSFLD